MNDNVQKQFSVMYNFLENNNCLCEFASETDPKEVWSQMYRGSFGTHDFSGQNDDQVLCIGFIELTAETYVNVETTHGCVCSHIQQLFEMLSSEDLWHLFIHSLENSKDQYLVHTFIRAFSAVLYASSKSVFEKHISQILNTVKGNIFDEKYSNFIDFFSNLVGFDFKPCETSYQINRCNNKIPYLSFSFIDLFQNLCMQLSQQWDSFMSQFYETMTGKYENTSLSKFLLLWQKLTISQLGKDLFHLYLNEQCVTEFFLNAYNLDVISLRMYADIIMQFFTSSPNMEPSQKNTKALEVAVTSALENNFFSLLPYNVQITGFCIISSSEDSKRHLLSSSGNVPICDTIIVKKVIFVFLNVIADIENKQLIGNAVQRTFSYVKQIFCIASDEPACRWILDVFIDQDDILIGIMLALLRIYINLKQDSANFPECIELRNSLNPHGIFISFLQRIGFDHNELLAFLTSDETCFLFYLVQYLKLLFKEWDVFKEIHESLVKFNEDVTEVTMLDSSVKGSSGVMHKPPGKMLLVSYSSSSSEDESESATKTEIETALHPNSFKGLETLINLKRAITKLVDAGEFPYNIEPLILLLQDCESYYKQNPS